MSSSLGLNRGQGQGVAGARGRRLLPSSGLGNRCEGTESQVARWELRLLRRLGHSSLCFGGDKAARNCIHTELSSIGNRKSFVPFGESPIFHSGPICVPQPCHSPDSAIFPQWALMFSPGRSALLNVMVWNGPAQGWKTELIQLRPRGPGL